MKIYCVKISNFRGYNNEISIPINDFTAIIGKNDIGKSSIFEALDIFFNEGSGCIKLDQNDINIQNAVNNNNEITITVEFTDLPDQVVIDETYHTNLLDEYLLNSQQRLEVIKKYPNAGKPKIFLKALHPANQDCSDLMSKKQTDLINLLNRLQIECNNRNSNSCIRQAIWRHFGNELNLREQEIEIAKEDSKKIWEKLSTYLPRYSLFRSDRKNCDGDEEIQDPLKDAVKEILTTDDEVQQMLNDVATRISRHLNDVSGRTLEKLREMDPAIADTLTPNIASAESLKWADVFKNVSITGDNISINKRGSGVRRLILLNFFRAEAERHFDENHQNNIIYAIEEPETSQHIANQQKLIRALKAIVENNPSAQVLITTHSSTIVKELRNDDIRIIKKNDNGGRIVVNPPIGLFGYPSLCEINFTVFDDYSIEYFNELYGHIVFSDWLKSYKTEYSDTKQYIDARFPERGPSSLNTTEYIRHQIHHPENTLNPRYTQEEFMTSISQMRNFIEGKVTLQNPEELVGNNVAEVRHAFVNG